MKTALLLSAGGMFGAWQAGAWKALGEVFRPDVVIGASAGALNGWAIAGECPPGELAEQWLDPRLQALRPFGAGPLEKRVRELFQTWSPKIPYAVTAVQVPQLRLRLFRGEEITWRHLMAACALPVAYPPVRIERKWYVDGGLLGALPLWAAAEMGAARVVALDALPLLPSRTIRALAQALRWLRPAPPRPAGLEIVRVTPSRPLGSLRDAILWDRETVRRWIQLGEDDIKLGLCRSSGSIA